MPSSTTSQEQRLRGLRRYLGIYLALWKNSVVREMQFKGNFLLWIVVEMVWFALQVTFIHVIYLHTDRIADWSRWEVVALIGCSHLIQQTFQAIFLVNCTNLSELVRTGKLDFMLLLPVNTRFLVSLRQVDLGAFINAASGGVVLCYALWKLGVEPTFARIIAFIFLCLFGIAIHYGILFFLATISFWTVRAQGIVWGYYSMLHIARTPDSVFRGWMRVMFSYLLPLLLVVNVPVRWLVARLDAPLQAFGLFAMAVACILISEWFWRVSVGRYTSASS